MIALPLRAFLGASWRVCLVGAAILAAGSAYTPPVAVVTTFVLLGPLLGFWRRRAGAARLWRWLLQASLVAYAAPLWFTPQYGRLVAAALCLAVLCGLLAGARPAPVWRRR